MTTLYNINFNDIDDFQTLENLIELSEHEILNRNIEYFWSILPIKMKKSLFGNSINALYDTTSILTDNEYAIMHNLFSNGLFADLEDFFINKYNKEQQINNPTDNFVDFISKVKYSTDILVVLSFDNYIFVGSKSKRIIKKHISYLNRTNTLTVVDKFKIKTGFLQFSTIYILKKHEK